LPKVGISTDPNIRISWLVAERIPSIERPVIFTGFAMLGWFHALMPKEERFFDLFARHSEAVLAGATALRAMLDGGSAVKSNYETVMAREHDADDVTRDVLIAVRRTFITPFDRGNIRELITSMDNSIDQMQKNYHLVRIERIYSSNARHGGRDRAMRAACTRSGFVAAPAQCRGKPHQRPNCANFRTGRPCR